MLLVVGMSASRWLIPLFVATATVASSARAEPRQGGNVVCAAGDALCTRTRLENVTCFIDLARGGTELPRPKVCVRPGPTRLGSRWGASLELRF